MASRTPVVITKKQAKKQINHFGRSLIVYILACMMISYGFRFLQQKLPSLFEKYDYAVFTLVCSLILILLTIIPFMISASALHLKIRDYLQKPDLKPGRMFAVICVGVCLYLITISISTLFYFFSHTENMQYAFLGQFNGRLNMTRNVLYFLLYVIIRPICDEYIFRGIIQRQLGHYGRYFGVIASAVLYAIAQPNLVAALPCFVVGWYLALVTLRYHSIRPAVTVHISLELFRWLIAIVPANLMWIVYVLIILVFAASALFIYQRRVDTSMVRYGATEGKLWKILFTSSSIDVCCVLFVINLILSFLA